MELPIKARMKFAAMIDGEQIAYDGVLSATRHISTLNKSLGTAPANEIPNIEFEISRWRGKLDEAQRKHRALADLNVRLRNFITTANAAFDDAKPAQVKIGKGETITAAAIRVRERIAALALERSRSRPRLMSRDCVSAASQKSPSAMASPSTSFSMPMSKVHGRRGKIWRLRSHTLILSAFCNASSKISKRCRNRRSRSAPRPERRSWPPLTPNY
jgi:hypothetical protein